MDEKRQYDEAVKAIKKAILQGQLEAVKNVNQLVREVGSLPTGSTATFTVIRGGKRLPMINVKVEERQKDVASSNNKLWPGFIAAPLTDDIKEDLKIDDKKLKGVVVTAVQEKSPAV